MEKQKKLHFLLMVLFLFLFANSVLIDVIAIKETTDIGDHVNLSRKNPNNEVRIRRLGKQLVRKPEDELVKSDNGGGRTLFRTGPLINGPAAAPSPIPLETIDPTKLHVHSKPRHMPTWCWILIGFVIFASIVIITWVLWYYCSHRTAQTAENKNEEMELGDIESLSSSTVENIYKDIFNVPDPAASATPRRNPAKPWHSCGIFAVILFIAGAIWHYYLHHGDTESHE